MNSHIERRGAPRFAVAQRATAVWPAESVACMVTDVSATGARIGFGKEIAAPKRFVLHFAASGERTDVQLVWQRKYVAGIRFLASGGRFARLRAWLRPGLLLKTIVQGY